MPRKIMVVDSSASMRRIIRTMILANINDAEVSESSDVAETIEKLAQAEYHVVLFSRESSTDQWLKFMKQASNDSAGKYPTRFVVFTSSKQQEFMEQIKDAGVTDCLIIPCSAQALAVTIDRAFNPYDLRSTKRYNLPDTIAILEQGEESTQAEVINISTGGFLCELAYSPHYNWSAPVMTTVQFPMGGEMLSAGGLYSVMIRLSVVESNPDFSPKRVRVAYKFTMVPANTKEVFEKVFAYIEAQEQKFES